MSINKQLEELYGKHYNKALLAKNNLSISSPLLIEVNEGKYNSSEIKVMIIGQETYGWHGEFGSKNIKALMNGYDEYLTKNIRGKNKRAFWKGFHYFEKELNNFHQDKKVYYIWNNLIKIGKFGGKGMTKKN